MGYLKYAVWFLCSISLYSSLSGFSEKNDRENDRLHGHVREIKSERFTYRESESGKVRKTYIVRRIRKYNRAGMYVKISHRETGPVPSVKKFHYSNGRLIKTSGSSGVCKYFYVNGRLDKTVHARSRSFGKVVEQYFYSGGLLSRIDMGKGQGYYYRYDRNRKLVEMTYKFAADYIVFKNIYDYSKKYFSYTQVMGRGGELYFAITFKYGKKDLRSKTYWIWKGRNIVTLIAHHKYDRHGNWTERVFKDSKNREWEKETRIIRYYSN